MSNLWPSWLAGLNDDQGLPIRVSNNRGVDERSAYPFDLPSPTSLSHPPPADMSTSSIRLTQTGDRHSHEPQRSPAPIKPIGTEVPQSTPSLPTSPQGTTLESQLESMLQMKEEQLRLVHEYRERILAQKLELTQSVNTLQEAERSQRTDAPKLHLKLREEITKASQTWKRENEQHLRQMLTHSLPPTDDTPGQGSPSSIASVPAGRAAARGNDEAFAVEIGGALIVEVRRLQNLVRQRDETIQELGKERVGLEEGLRSIQKKSEEQQATVGRCKREVVNADARFQEIRGRLEIAQQDFKKKEKQLKSTIEQLRGAFEIERCEKDKIYTELKGLKMEHLVDVARLSKSVLALQREKAVLEESIENASRTDSSSKAPACPGGWDPSSRHREEADALRQVVTSCQRQISRLKDALAHERQLAQQYKGLLEKEGLLGTKSVEGFNDKASQGSGNGILSLAAKIGAVLAPPPTHSLQVVNRESLLADEDGKEALPTDKVPVASQAKADKKDPFDVDEPDVSGDIDDWISVGSLSE
ncbi:hypothetical protein FRB99_003244 [Tulasnella sp. 403]|nr:hypothetical protein FRB99_003244 [Tulasnella sp. 403]